MKTVLMLDKTFSKINRILSQICGILLFAIIILLVVNTLTRELGYPIEGINSWSVIILVMVVYLGLSTTESTDQHAKVEIFPEYLGDRNKPLLIIIDIIKLITIGLFFYVSINNLALSIQSGETMADVVRVPIWPAKLTILIGLFFYELQILLNLFKRIFNIEFESDEDLSGNL